MAVDDEFAVSQLRARGWTPRAIAQYLGEPDRLTTNPHYRSGPPMRLYQRDRVEAAEQLPQVAAIIAAKTKRGAPAQRSAEAKRHKLLETIETLEIEIIKLDPTTLRAKAIENYNSAARRSRDDYRAFDDSDPKFLARITVNYIRHELTSYDSAIDSTAHRVGQFDAIDRIRERVYDAIAEAYPELDGECWRQKTEKRGS